MAKWWKIAVALPLILTIRCFMQWAIINVLPQFYVFDAANLQTIVQASINELNIDASAEELMVSIHDKLKAEYPKYIVDSYTKDDWVFNNAGNAMGTMVVLHASLTEYLIFFGSAVGAGGHTGIHSADDYFTVFYGEEQAALPGATKPERYLPGDQHHLPYGVTKQYNMPGGSFALELAQGYIPFMLPFGFLETFTSTLDFHTLIQTIKITAQHMVHHLIRGKI